jgi:hypothetical protein
MAAGQASAGAGEARRRPPVFTTERVKTGEPSRRVREAGHHRELGAARA